MASGDFVLVMSFIGSVIKSIFNILDSVYFGDYSLLSIFLSIIVLRVFLWFVGRLLGTHLDTAIEDTANSQSIKVGAFWRSNYQKYDTVRHKNKMRLERKLGLRGTRQKYNSFHSFHMDFFQNNRKKNYGRK